MREPRDYAEIAEDFLGWVDEYKRRKRWWIFAMVVTAAAIVGVAIWLVFR